MSGKEIAAEGLTKPLLGQPFAPFKERLGMVNMGGIGIGLCSFGSSFSPHRIQSSCFQAPRRWPRPVERARRKQHKHGAKNQRTSRHTKVPSP